MSDYADKHIQRLIAEFPRLDTAPSLTLDALPYVRMATINVGSHWYNLGIFFHLSTNFLDETRLRFRHNTDRCLTAVIAEWLKNSSSGTPTWKAVITAVASRVGGDNPSEARKIAKEFSRYGQLTEFKNLDKVDDRPLSSKELLSVNAALMEGVADKWMSVGLLLGIPYHRLEACELEETLNKRLTQMLTEWLGRRYDTHTFGEPSWRKLVEVVAARAGGSHNYLANQVAKQHPVQAVQAQDESYVGSSSASRPSGPPQPEDVISQANLAALMELLRPLAPKWNLLALQLGVPMEDIQITMAKPLLMPGAPLSYMQEILYIWLQQKPPEQPWPTVDRLCSALKGDVIDESTLAEDVKMALLGGRQR